MLTFESKITDLIRSLATSLQLSMLLPAMLLVSGIAWLVNPSALKGNNELLAALGVIALTVSYLFNAFNMVFLRMLEGYVEGDSMPLSLLRDYQLCKFFRHHQRIHKYQQNINSIKSYKSKLAFERKLSLEERQKLEAWERSWRDQIIHEMERLEERYPPTPDRIMATGLGNTIAAFELYPERRYHIDYETLWTRFVPTIMEKKYAGFIESEKTLLDFFVNLLVVIALLWSVAVIVFACTGQIVAGVLFILLPLFAYILYKGSCVAASNWGITVKASFDLYRHELKKALNLELPENATLEDERRMWRDISEFLAYGRERDTPAFDYTPWRADKTPTSSKEALL